MKATPGIVFLVFVASCSSAVSSGYPALATTCHTAVDCADAGAGFVCEDGGCTPATCTCDEQCPASLGCDFQGQGLALGECAGPRPQLPCGGDGG